MDEAIFSICSWIKRVSVNCPVTKQVSFLPCFLCRLCWFHYFDWKGKKGRFISDYLESRNQFKAGATSQYLLPLREAKTCLRISWIPKIMDPIFFLFKTIFAHWNCFQSPVATDDKDGHGLKLEKDGPTYMYVSGKLPTYPSPKPTLCSKCEVSVNVGLREG